MTIHIGNDFLAGFIFGLMVLALTAFFLAENEESDENEEITSVETINEDILGQDIDTNLISDGNHTFGELYDHRITNFIALCRNLKKGNNTIGQPDNIL